MTEKAILVEKLSKRYHIGLKEKRHDTLGGSIASWLLSPVSNFKRLRRLSGFGGASDGVDVIWALRDVSFEVGAGEVVGVIGRNGAGKSTLLKVLSRITQPTNGRVKIRGRVSSLLEVGTGFHPDLSGRENVFLNGSILGMKKGEIQSKFDEIVDFSGVSNFIDTPVKFYSSGMRVRLAFSVAAHLEPEILLVDEVLAVGDAAFQKKCLGMMGEVAQNGRTVLFVSHNLGAIGSLCPATLYLEDGRIAEIGPTESVIAAYVNHTSAGMPDQGISDLRFKERPAGHGNRTVQFEWVRTLDMEGHQKGTFREGEPIIIEVVFAVMNAVRDLRLGCSVLRLDPNVELFSVPSPEYTHEIEAGRYSMRLRIDPNYLSEGSYKPVLKMFVAGVRQETLPETLRFHIVRYVTGGERNAHLLRWAAGLVRLPYDWEEMQSESGSTLREESELATLTSGNDPSLSSEKTL